MNLIEVMSNGDIESLGSVISEYTCMVVFRSLTGLLIFGLGNIVTSRR
jgi:hypothetical protein